MPDKIINKISDIIGITIFGYYDERELKNTTSASAFSYKAAKLAISLLADHTNKLADTTNINDHLFFNRMTEFLKNEIK